jgi:hypothetical protein
MKNRSKHTLSAKSQAHCGAPRSRNLAAAVAAAAFAGLSIVPAVQADITGFTQAGVGPTDYTLNTNTAGIPTITSGTLNLTTAANGEATSAWFNTAQTLSNFTAAFTYDFVNGTAPPADGFAFVLQSSGLTALGGGGGALGYLGIDKSVALGFDLWSGGAGTANGNTAFSAANNSLGATYGGFNNYASVAPVALRDAANNINISIAYREGVFTETLSQTVSGTTNTFTRSAFYNVADRVGATGFVGFTGGTGGANAAQNLTGFTFTTGNAPAVTPAAQPVAGVPTGGPGVWGIREIQSGTALGNLTDALNAVTSGGTSIVNYTAPVVNLQDTGGRGNFLNDSLYRIDPDQVGVDTDGINNVAVIATGTVRIPTTGMYTFGVNSDDGFRMTIGGQRFEGAFGQAGTAINANGALEFNAGRGVDNSLGTIFLKAGDYPIQVLNWEGGGGAAVEVYASPGIKTAYDPSTFNLIGAGAIAGNTGRNKVQTVSTWTYEPYTNASNVTDVTNAHFGLASPAVKGTTVTVPTVNFIDPQGANAGSHGADQANFPGDTGADDNNFGGFAQATLTIAAGDAGRYTFVMYTDDDSRFRILLGAVPVPLVGTSVGDVFDSDGAGGNDTFGTNGCCFDQFGHYDLAAGTYTIQAAFHEGGGGAGFFLYGTQGERNTFDPAAFQLLGANTSGATWNTNVPAGLQLVPEPTSISMLGLAAVGLMARRRRQQA